MNLKVQLFAAARDAAGKSPIDLALPTDSTVGELKQQLLADIPELKGMASSLMVAVNNEFANENQRLNASDEVACFPPVSGG